MTIYLRDDWGSTGAQGGNQMGQAAEGYVHHFNSGIAPCRTVADAMSRMRGAQAYHRGQGWGDIGYSWCVDDLGNIYEGRGWWRTGAHTYGYNSKGYAACWLGDSLVASPSELAVGGLAQVFRMGIAAGALVARPTIVAHKDRNPDTACCGGPLYSRLEDIRALVLSGGTQQSAVKEEDDMARAFVAPGDTMIIVDGGTYHPVRGVSWPATHKGLTDLAAAGAIQAHGDGTLWKPISAEALALLKEV